MRASKLLGAAAAAIVLVASLPAQARESLPGKNPWRDSEIDYEHAVSALAFDKGAEQTYTGYYAHRLTLMPYWHVTDYLYFRGKLDLEQEFTNTVLTETKYKHEVVLSDLLIDVASKGVTEPFTGIKLGGGVRFGFPTSKASQAATMRFSVSPGLNVSRKFALLEGLTLGWGVRTNFFNHKYTVGQANSSWLATCTDPDSCSQFTQLENPRNAWLSVAHGPTIAFEPYTGFTLDLGYSFLYGFPYALSKDEKFNVPIDESVQDVRFADWFTAAITYMPLDYLGVSLNVSTLAGTLRPDSKYRTPFFNRATQLSLSLALSIDPLIGKFQ